MVMMVQREEERLRAKEEKDKRQRKEQFGGTGNAACPRLSDPGTGLGAEAADGEGQSKGKRWSVDILSLVSCGKVHLSRHGLCATCLGTHLCETEEIRKLEGKKLSSFLQCEPLKSRKEETLQPAFLPVRVGHIRSQVKQVSFTLLQAEVVPGSVLGKQGIRGYLQGLPEISWFCYFNVFGPLHSFILHECQDG